MTSDAWRRERDVAVGIVKDAAVLARAIEQESDRTAFLKPDLSPVTVGDLAMGHAELVQQPGEFFH